MVSLRCKMMVKEELNKLGLFPVEVTLGEVEINQPVSLVQRQEIKAALLKLGLELMDDKKAILTEKIKSAIIEMIHHSDTLPHTNFSNYLSDKLRYDYTYLANLFSEAAGVTIEQFVILHKIERAKEFIIYDELNLTEIAFKLHYSSVAHLSNQFKKVTGLTPSFFKSLKQKKRIALENV